MTRAKRLLVGREPELSALAEIVPTRPVSLVGEAGIGKTTLLRAAADETGLPVFEGFGLASLSWMPYLPLAHAFGEEPPRGDHAFVAAWAAARGEGGLLLLDDLQWADADTLALLPLLAGRVRIAAAVRRGDPGSLRAERQARDAGFALLPVGALSPDAARQLVRRLRPDLGAAEVAGVVGRAGGSPLMLEELAREDGVHDTLRLSLGARLHRCSPAAQEAMALLGLLGRPAERSVLPEEADELVEAGLVAGGPLLAPRHALLGETAASELDGDARRGLHARLARLVEDPGEAARHHQAAGQPEAARTKALAAAEAATRPAERGRHLAVAAACSAGADADELRLQAADALLGAGEHEQALEVVAAVAGDGTETRARVALARSRAHFWIGDMDAHRAAIREGLALVAGSGSPTEVRLRIEGSRLPLWGSEEKQLPAVREVWELAVRTGVEVTHAHLLLGIAHYVDGDLQCRGHLTAARAAALDAGQHELACEAAEFLCAALQANGDPEEALAEAQAMQEWCNAHGLRTQESIFRWLRGRVANASRGPSPEAIADLETALAEPGIGARADQIAADLAMALADAGQVEDARTRLDATPLRTDIGAVAVAVARAEVEWSAGRPAAALRALDELPSRSFEALAEYGAAIGVARGWALLDLGRRSEVLLGPLDVWRLGAGAEPELAALACELDESGSARAERLFDEAADLHAGHLLHWELRCRWGAAEAALRRGDTAGAKARLLVLEERLEDGAMRPLLGRVRGSLRRVGVVREPRRQAQGGPGRLSAREREVMTLVAAGQSSAKIALRLGVSPATVESQVRSAMAKLGAKTRLQAALLAAEE